MHFCLVHYPVLIKEIPSLMLWAINVTRVYGSANCQHGINYYYVYSSYACSEVKHKDNRLKTACVLSITVQHFVGRIKTNHLISKCFNSAAVLRQQWKHVRLHRFRSFSLLLLSSTITAVSTCVMQLEQETLDMYTDQTSRASSVTNVAFWIRTMLFEISSIFYRYPASDGKQLLMLLRLIDYSVWRMRNNSEDTVCSMQTCCNGLSKHRRWKVTDEEKWTWPSAGLPWDSGFIAMIQ